MKINIKYALVSWLLSSLFSASVLAKGDLQFATYEADAPKALVLWLPSERGVLPQEQTYAQQLAQKGTTVWMPDFFESYFLPIAPSSLLKVPMAEVGEVIKQFVKTQPELPHYIMTSNRTAALVLKWWVEEPRSNLGVVLINPNTFVSTPEPGQTAQYWPEVQRVNAPIYILQAELSPWRWHISSLVETLEAGGSDVFMQMQHKLRDRYYFRKDASEFEKDRAKDLVKELQLAMQLLKPSLKQQRVSAAGEKSVVTEVKVPERRVGMQVYQGSQQRSLQLQDLDNQLVDLQAQKGKVVLLNFWASWCPPCVHEMPSMEGLKNQLKGQPFEILAVNLAEERVDIQQFKKEHQLTFTILLDSLGSAVQEWQVFAYPSSYVIDKKGKIRYALFGSYDWQQAEALETIQKLLAE